MNDRVAGVEPRDDSFGRVELDHAANIHRKTRNASWVYDYRGISARATYHSIRFAFAKTHESRPRFRKNSPLLKTLTRFHSGDDLCHAAILDADKTLLRKEIADRFQSEVFVEIEREPAAEA